MPLAFGRVCAAAKGVSDARVSLSHMVCSHWVARAAHRVLSRAGACRVPCMTCVDIARRRAHGPVESRVLCALDLDPLRSEIGHSFPFSFKTVPLKIEIACEVSAPHTTGHSLTARSAHTSQGHATERVQSVHPQSPVAPHPRAALSHCLIHCRTSPSDRRSPTLL